MDARVLSAIREVRYELKEPGSKWPRGRFEQQSYSRWAINELIFYIYKSEPMPTIQAVEEFIRKMDDYSCRSQHTSFAFSVAHDIAVSVLDILIAMN